MEKTGEEFNKLPKEEAMIQANMIRRGLKIDDEGTMGYFFNRETNKEERIYPTAEDYQKANEAIDELINLAETETPGKRMMLKIEKVLEGINYHIKDFILSQALQPGGSNGVLSYQLNEMEKNYQVVKERLMSAKERLAKERELAEQYG